MSMRDSIHSLNHNGFNGNGAFDPNFEDFSRAPDSPYSPGIIETEIMSNRSSVYSDMLNFHDKSQDSNNRDSLINVINANDGLNQDNVDYFSIKSDFKDGNLSNFKDENLSDKQDGDHSKNNSKHIVSSTLDAAALVDLDGISLDEDANWLLSKKPSHARSTNAINWIKGEKDDVKKSESKSSLLKRYSSGKIEKFQDFGQVTQIIGVPPLSASNKDLSSIGKELSLNKQQENDGTDLSNHQPSLTTSNTKLNFGSGYVLADLTDVQNAAKLQEQSLRMSFSTPLVNSSKGLSLKASNKKLNEAGTTNKLKANQGMSGDAVKSRVSARSTARTAAPLSQYNSNGMMNKKLNDKSSNAEPFQKSLPNLTRKLQPARTQTGGRVQRSMLPAPPVRTASQPSVTSQLKPFQRIPPQRTSSTLLKPQAMTLNQRDPIKKTSMRAPPTSLNSSSRLPPASRQPLSTRQPTSNPSRQPLSGTTRQPLSGTTRQPLSGTTRQPLSGTTRQPLSGTTRQSLASSRQLPSSNNRQLPSSNNRQLPSSNNRAPLNNNVRVATNTTSRTTTNSSRLASGLRTPLNNPPVNNRGVNASQTRDRTSTNMSRNPPALFNAHNQPSLSNRSNLASAASRTNAASNRSNISMARGPPMASNAPINTRNNTLSSANRSMGKMNTIASNNFSSRTGRAPPHSSALASNPVNRAAPANKPLSTARSNTPRNPFNSTLSKPRPTKPFSAIESRSNRDGNERQREDWKEGCF